MLRLLPILGLLGLVVNGCEDYSVPDFPNSAPLLTVGKIETNDVVTDTFKVRLTATDDQYVNSLGFSIVNKDEGNALEYTWKVSFGVQAGQTKPQPTLDTTRMFSIVSGRLITGNYQLRAEVGDVQGAKDIKIIDFKVNDSLKLVSNVDSPPTSIANFSENVIFSGALSADTSVGLAVVPSAGFNTAKVDFLLTKKGGKLFISSPSSSSAQTDGNGKALFPGMNNSRVTSFKQVKGATKALVDNFLSEADSSKQLANLFSPFNDAANGNSTNSLEIRTRTVYTGRTADNYPFLLYVDKIDGSDVTISFIFNHNSNATIYKIKKFDLTHSFDDRSFSAGAYSLKDLMLVKQDTYPVAQGSIDFFVGRNLADKFFISSPKEMSSVDSLKSFLPAGTSLTRTAEFRTTKLSVTQFNNDDSLKTSRGLLDLFDKAGPSGLSRVWIETDKVYIAKNADGRPFAFYISATNKNEVTINIKYKRYYP